MIGSIGAANGYATKGNFPPASRAPEVSVQMDILDKELGAQREAIERLASRLESVLSSEQPREDAGNKRAQSTSCVLATRIEITSVAVANNTAWIESFLRRIEI